MEVNGQHEKHVGGASSSPEHHHAVFVHRITTCTGQSYAVDNIKVSILRCTSVSEPMGIFYQF